MTLFIGSPQGGWSSTGPPLALTYARRARVTARGNERRLMREDIAGQTDLCLPQCSDDLLRSVSLPSHPDLLAEKLQTRSIVTLHLVSFQGVRSVALTRGARSLTIISTTPSLDPAE